MISIVDSSNWTQIINIMIQTIVQHPNQSFQRLIIACPKKKSLQLTKACVVSLTWIQVMRDQFIEYPAAINSSAASNYTLLQTLIK